MPIFGSNASFLSDDEIATVTNDMLRDTKHELILVSPWIGADHHSFDKLLDCIQRGVQVTLFCRPPSEQEHMHLAAIKRLNALGVKILFDSVLHAKIVVIDNEEVLVSSANLIHTSQVRNHEAGIVTFDKKIVRGAIDYLDTLRKRIEAEAKQYCELCYKEITIDPDKPLCFDCWKSNRGYHKQSKGKKK